MLVLVVVVAGLPGHLEGFLEGPCALGSPLHVAPLLCPSGRGGQDLEFHCEPSGDQAGGGCAL